MHDVEIMNEFNHRQDRFIVALLKACAKKKDLNEGGRLHAEILERGLLERSPYIASGLVSMYAKCGALEKAQRVLKELPDQNRNIVSWNALIGGYAQEGKGRDALHCFEQMQSEGICPDNVTFICILKACGKIRAVDEGKHIHGKIVTGGLLEKDVMVGNALVDMYMKCGLLQKARKVFEELPIRDVISWNVLIAGYSSHLEGEAREALNCYEQMRRQGICPDAITFICILKACGKVRAIDKGEQIHDEIVGRGLLEKDVMVGATLVDMYAKCGVLLKAQNVLEQLPIRNVVSWSALIVGCVEQGRGHEALNNFAQMKIEGLFPDAVTFICILRACGSTGDIDKGKEIHDRIETRGLLETDVALGTALVDMYAKCGMLAKARQVLDALPVRNVASWSAVITGHIQEGEGHEALNCFEQMQSEGLCPDIVTFICILNACGILGDLEKGKQIHNEIVRRGFLRKDVLIGNALVDMYVKCNQLSRAREVIEQLPTRNIVSWNALIAGYAQQGQDCEALDCFGQMQSENLCPDVVTFICLLKACGRTGYKEKGIQIHQEVVKRGLLKKDIVLGTALVDMYAKCGMLAKAAQVLEEIPFRDEIMWNALIAGCAQLGECQEALIYFEQMQKEGLSPGVVTFICILKACGITSSLEKGIQVHEMIVRRGLLEKDVVLGNALVDMYAKCGVLAKACQVLKQLPVQSVVSWNALIAGYVQQGQGFKALNCFEQMQSEGITPDEITLISTLKACCGTGAMEKGKKIHDEIISRDLLKKDIVLGATLMNMYAKYGMLAKAQQVLEELPVRDVVVWNVLIGGYAQQGQCHEALNYFSWNQKEGLLPDEVTFICILNACGKAGAIDKGKQIHNEIIKRGLLENNLMLGNGLVDMYVKCGMLVKAQEALEELPTRDVVSWNSLIAGFAQHGHSHEALNCFEWMQCEGLCPDEVTCLCILTVCSHSGLLDEGEEIFANMTTKYGIIPNLEHHTCMIAILGCAGHFDKALRAIKAMTSSSYATIWVTLLGACSRWGNVKLAKLAFDHAVYLDKTCAAAYILMANMFAALGMQEEAENIEALRLKSAVWADYENSLRRCNFMKLSRKNGGAIESSSG